MCYHLVFVCLLFFFSDRSICFRFESCRGDGQGTSCSTGCQVIYEDHMLYEWNSKCWDVIVCWASVGSSWQDKFCYHALCGTHCGFDTVTYRLFLWEEIVTNRSDSVVEKGSKLMDVKDFANCRECVAPQSVAIEALVVSCDIWLRWILDFRHLWVVVYSLPCPHTGSDHIPFCPHALDTETLFIHAIVFHPLLLGSYMGSVSPPSTK